MRVILEWQFKFPENKTPEARMKVMEGIRDYLKEASLHVGGVKVEPNDVFLFNTGTRSAREKDPTPDSLMINIDVDTRTEFV